MTTNVRILREDPNSINKSSQFVSTAMVSTETALLFEDYRKGRKTLEEARQEIDSLSANDLTTVPFSVYLNVHEHHASIIFFRTDVLNRSGSNVEETHKLANMTRGIRVFFNENSFQVVNPIPVRRIDLFTEDGQEYRIEMNGDRLKKRLYKMFKCYEVIGISDFDIEWAYLMAARDWYDTAANNCLSFSKRIIQEIHRQVTGEDLNKHEMSELKKLYISFPGESSLESFQSRISFFLSPAVLKALLVIALLILVAIYIEVRLRYKSDMCD